MGYFTRGAFLDESSGVAASLGRLKLSRAAGSIGAGKYVVFGTLGRGGMADIQLGAAQGPKGFSKLVVVKRLRLLVADDAAIVGMFMDEARLAARLNHPNVIHTYEFGEERGSYFIVMEYLDGQSLDGLLQAVGFSKRVAPALWAKVIADALAGLHYAHELRDYDGTPLQIIHRDVSPQNIVLTYDGRVKLVDFGIAKATLNVAKTESQIIKGKLAYMAPEQAEDIAEIDRRADVFSMGIVLWECLTGKRLVTGDARAAISKIVNAQFDAPSKVDPHVPPELDAITMRALEREPERRFQTAEEMREALERYLRTTEEVFGEKQIGALMVDLFTQEREEGRRQIRVHMAEVSAQRVLTDDDTLNELPSGQLLAELAAPAGTEQAEPKGRRDRRAITESIQSIRAVRVRTSVPSAPEGWGGGMWATRVAALSALAAIVVFGLIALRRGPEVSSAPGAGAEGARESAVSLPAAPRARVVVRVTPADAVVRLDGVVVANPFIGTFARDEIDHRIEVAKPGYVPTSKVFRLNQDDVLVDFALVRTEEAQQPEAAPPAPRNGSRP